MNEELTHNPRNAVTHSIERIEYRGGTAVRKVLNGTNASDTPPEWVASAEPRHWNYWRREALLYQSELRETLENSGTRIPKLLQIEEGENQTHLILEDIQGRSGQDLTLQDYSRIALQWGQAQGLLAKTDWQTPWSSTKFLSSYAASKPVNYGLLFDDEAWSRPLIANNWSQQLRDQLIFLYENRLALFTIVEDSKRIPSHLDFWPNNVFVDTQDQLVPVDWAFFGEGAYGEDIANFVPDAVFDDFVAPDLLPALEREMFSAYLQGLERGGVSVDAKEVERTFHACAVKYVWLAPLLLEKAGQETQQAYGGALLDDANRQYKHRGLTLSYLCDWASAVL